MKKIITAIENPELNKKLSKLNEYKVISKDIQYKEGIIEVLDSETDIDTIILKSNIPGESDLKEFINDLIYLKENLEIIIFLENKDNELIDFLNSKGISKVYFEEINLENIIRSLEEKKRGDNLEVGQPIQNSQQKAKGIIVVSGNAGTREKPIFGIFSKTHGNTKYKNYFNRF